MPLILKRSSLFVLVAILFSGCQGLHFDGVIDVVPPEPNDSSIEDHPKEKQNEPEENSKTDRA